VRAIPGPSSLPNPGDLHGPAPVSDRDDLDRPLAERVKAASYACMAYWFYRWDWGEAIAFDGLLATAEALAWDAALDYIDAELERWLRSAPNGNLHSARLGPCNVLLSRRSSFEALEADNLLRQIATHSAEALHASSGLMLDAREQIYVDSLYGDPLFLWRAGDAFQNEGWRQAAIALALGHLAELQDEESGLVRHYAQGGTSTSGRHPIYWGRGNGWAALGLSDLLSVVPGNVPGRDELAARYRLLIDGLAHHQAPGGMWRNLIDRDSSYPESSTTAMVEAAISSSVATSALPERFSEVADAAWSAIEHRIDPSGHFSGVSYRPGLNRSADRYEHVPAVGLYPWGNGAYLRAAARRLGRMTDKTP